MHNIAIVALFLSGCAKHPGLLPPRHPYAPSDDSALMAVRQVPVTTPTPAADEPPVTLPPGVVEPQIYIDWRAKGRPMLTLEVTPHDQSYSVFITPDGSQMPDGTVLFVLQDLVGAFDTVLLNPKTQQVWASVKIGKAPVDLPVTKTEESGAMGTGYHIGPAPVISGVTAG